MRKKLKKYKKKIILFLSKVIYSDKKNLIIEKFERNKYMRVSYIFKYDRKCNIRHNIRFNKENVNNI